MYFYIPTDYILNNPIHLLISNIIYLINQPSKLKYIHLHIYRSTDIRFLKKRKGETKEGEDFVPFYPKSRDKSLRVEPWRKRERNCTFTIPDIPPWHGWKGRSGGFSRGKRIKGLISRLGSSSRSRTRTAQYTATCHSASVSTLCRLYLSALGSGGNKGLRYHAMVYDTIYTIHIYVLVGREIKPIT